MQALPSLEISLEFSQSGMDHKRSPGGGRPNWDTTGLPVRGTAPTKLGHCGAATPMDSLHRVRLFFFLFLGAAGANGLLRVGFDGA
ncbi:predicted protein [Uncinocarpus reesii 1704]|uniref:Uncharacterized protein n=1 Tax=Uncinocarpus reesii (strain UAMH 1704) TaxID=336963 RepID=C4JVX0_UNCRE|nr:uncharacterized protein UREG_06712 [Uncinocarpus reesii 1704]EEP81847.1 predicted protein [Uncinocarpus reesii 1704]